MCFEGLTQYPETETGLWCNMCTSLPPLWCFLCSLCVEGSTHRNVGKGHDRHSYFYFIGKGKFRCQRYSVGWSEDLIPKRWKRQTGSQTVFERPILHKQQCYRNTPFFHLKPFVLCISQKRFSSQLSSDPSVVFQGPINAPHSS